jgi:predicted transcriptional regulator
VQPDLRTTLDTTQPVISRLEEGGGTRNRIDTLARVATALSKVMPFVTRCPES